MPVRPQISNTEVFGTSILPLYSGYATQASHYETDQVSVSGADTNPIRNTA